MNKQLKTIILIIFIIGCLVIFWGFFKNVSAEELRDYIDHYGVWTPIIYIMVFTLLPVAFFPVPVLALAGGLLFGFWAGTLYTMIGAVLNSSLMFFLAKVLAREPVTAFLQNRLPEKWAKVLLKADPRRGFEIIFILRLIPVVPYNLINYGAGLTPIKFKNYTAATVLGILPGTLVFLNIGDKVLDIHDPGFIIAIALFVALIVISLLLAKKITPDHLAQEDPEEKETVSDCK